MIAGIFKCSCLACAVWVSDVPIVPEEGEAVPPLCGTLCRPGLCARAHVSLARRGGGAHVQVKRRAILRWVLYFSRVLAVGFVSQGGESRARAWVSSAPCLPCDVTTAT